MQRHMYTQQTYLQALARADTLDEFFHLATLLKRVSVHLLPMVKDSLREGLASGVRAQFSVETERLGDRQVRFDSEHGRARALFLAEDLTAAFIQTTVDTTNGVFWALNFNCARSEVGQKRKSHQTTYQGK